MRWRKALRSGTGRVVLAAALIVAGSVVPLPSGAGASGQAIRMVTLFARADIGPSVKLRLLDSHGVDVTSSCLQGHISAQAFMDWACPYSANDRVLHLTAPAGVSIHLKCNFPGGLVATSSSGAISLPASLGFPFCLAEAIPDTTYPSVARVELVGLHLAGVRLALSRDGQELSDGCTTIGFNTVCTEVPYGTWDVGPAAATPGPGVWAICHTTSAAGPTVTEDPLPPIEIRPETLSVVCTAQAAASQVIIHDFGIIPTDFYHYALRPVAGGADVPCTPTSPWPSWVCTPPTAGAYTLETNLVPADPYPQWFGCRATGPGAQSPGTAFPPVFLFVAGESDVYHCALAISLEHTQVVDLPTDLPSDPDLPTFGGGGTVWPYALGMLLVGAAMTRSSRRPVR